MRKFALSSGLGLLVVFAIAGHAELNHVHGSGQQQSVVSLLRNAFRRLVRIEPDREGPIYDGIRGNVVVVNPLNPAVEFVTPFDGEILDADEDIVIEVDIANWLVDPFKATPAATEFAIGKQEHQTGHTHVWIYDMDTGERVRFTGASGLLPTGDGGIHVSTAFTLPPGVYKAYVSLQNHDHTVATQSSAQSLPPIDAVAFVVE